MAKRQLRNRNFSSGSNTKSHDELTALRHRRFTDLEKELTDFRNAYDERLRRLLTGSDAKKAAAIRDECRREFGAGLAATIGQPDRMAEAHASARRKMEEALRRDVKCYSEIHDLQSKFSDNWAAIVTKKPGRRDAFVVHAGDWTPTVDVIDMQTFGPPFDLVFADAQGLALNQDGTQGISDDSSSVDLTLGFMDNDITVSGSNKWDEASNVVIGLSDLALGVRYTAPKAGSLNIGFTMRNLYSRLHGSLTDHWGFSHGDLLITHSVEGFVVRAGTPVDTAGSQEVTRVGWIDLSGDDATFNAPEIPSGPITFVVKVDGPPLAAGEQVELLAGSHTGVLSHIDNMGFIANATVWWQLESVQVFLTD